MRLIFHDGPFLSLQTFVNKSAEVYKQYENLVFDHLRSKFPLTPVRLSCHSRNLLKILFSSLFCENFRYIGVQSQCYCLASSVHWSVPVVPLMSGPQFAGISLVCLTR